MTRSIRRLGAARFAMQLAFLAPVGCVIFGGCSSGAKTVAGDCPTGGTGALGGAETVNGGASTGASAGVLGMAGEAGQPQAGADAADGGEGGSAPGSPQAGASGNVGSSTGGRGGTAGHSGSTSSGGMSNAGGHGGSAGHTGSAGSSTGGRAAAKCGDKVTSPPEFCDDGTNTNLSYGCSACTTLPTPIGAASQGGAASVPEQCDECLQKDTKPTTCYGCVDYRACYACLRRQPGSFGAGFCQNSSGDDDPTTLGLSFSPKRFSDLCFNPDSTEYKAATGGPAGSEPAGLVCQALLACMLRTGCALGDTNAMFDHCYCGAGPGESCGDAKFVAKGPCVNEMVDAFAPGPGSTGSALTAQIGTHIFDADPANAWRVLGVTYNIVNCAADPDGCADVCFPSSSNTGAGGTAGAVGVPGSSGHGGS